MSNITELVTTFYNAIIKSKPLFQPYSQFPDGCCQDTSWILKRFLDENGQSDICIVGSQYHSWIEQNGLIIDITYKQFEEKFNQIFDEIIITHDRTLHDRFPIESIYKLPYWKVYDSDDHVVELLDRYYHHVIKHI